MAVTTLPEKWQPKRETILVENICANSATGSGHLSLARRSPTSPTASPAWGCSSGSASNAPAPRICVMNWSMGIGELPHMRPTRSDWVRPSKRMSTRRTCQNNGRACLR